MRSLFEDREFVDGVSQSALFRFHGVGSGNLSDRRDLVDYWMRVIHASGGTAYTIKVYRDYAAAVIAAVDTEIGSYSGDLAVDGTLDGSTYKADQIQITIINTTALPSVDGLTVTLTFAVDATDALDAVWAYTSSPDLRALAFMTRIVQERTTAGRVFEGLHVSNVNIGRPGEQFRGWEIFFQTTHVEQAGGTGTRPVFHYEIAIELAFHVGRRGPNKEPVHSHSWTEARRYLGLLASLFWDEEAGLGGVICASGGTGGGKAIGGEIVAPEDSPYEGEHYLVGAVTLTAPIPMFRDFS